MGAPDPKHPSEKELSAINTSVTAANELKRLTPELHAGIMSALHRVEEHMRLGNGILEPQVAVQAWYQVMAEDKVAKRLGKLMKAGSQASSAHRTRVALEQAAEDAKS